MITLKEDVRNTIENSLDLMLVLGNRKYHGPFGTYIMIDSFAKEKMQLDCTFYYPNGKVFHKCTGDSVDRLPEEYVLD